ncbi:MAG: hypothetical protein HC837_10805 [Chloroflexaceae bacterium]|nr:hypothetical protein [Chloroflexaceae bacterium]
MRMVIFRVPLRVALWVSCMLVCTGCMAALQSNGSVNSDPSVNVGDPAVRQETLIEGSQALTDTIAAENNPAGGPITNPLSTTVMTDTAAISPESVPDVAVPLPIPESTVPESPLSGDQPVAVAPTAMGTAVAPEPTPPSAPFAPQPPAAEVIEPPPLPQISHEERWRKQQVNREIFGFDKPYTTRGSELWWYDPVQQQHVILGSFSGDFVAQARFVVLGQGMEALEVPYRVNQSYGLTSISSVLLERIHAAGYDEWIETYIFVTPNVQPL